MILQKNHSQYPAHVETPLWEDQHTTTERPDEIIEHLTRAGAAGQYRIIYVQAGKIVEKQFRIERYDAYRVKHKATRRPGLDADQGGTDAVADGPTK